MSDFNNPIIIVGDTPLQVGAIIEPEAAQQCDDCGTVAELRPYGPGGSAVCFDCAMKDEAGTAERFLAILEGDA